MLTLFLAGAALHGVQAEDVEKRAQGEARRILEGYKQDAGMLSLLEAGYSWSRADARVVPRDFRPAWLNDLQLPVFPSSQIRSYSLEDLLVRALRHSSRIKVLSDTPLIRETGIREAKGEFDTVAFVEGKYTYTNDPLATDRAVRDTNAPAPRRTFTSDEYSVGAGVRKKLATGTQVELSQQVTRLSDSTLDLDPNPQANARLTLAVVQPLLRGAGVSYNLATLNIARIDSQIARAEFIRDSESHLIEINRAYWELFFARAVFQQRKRLVQETEQIVGQSEARKNVDVPQSQILRARSALAERKAELIRSEAAIRNAQDRIVTLVNDPELVSQPRLELVPSDTLLLSPLDVELEAAATFALWNRTEIDQAFLLIRQASIREKVARNEVLPTLNLVLGGYLAGIKGEGDFMGAIDRQNKDTTPGLLAGLQFEFPIENNTAQARLARQRLETRQRMNELRLTIETILLEIKGAVREVKTSHRDMQAKYETVVAAGADLRNLQARRSLILGFDEVSAVNYIEYFLDSQERESRAQEALISTITSYRTALVVLERAKGNLLTYKDITRIPKGPDRLPRLQLDPPRPLLRSSVTLRTGK